MGARKNLMKKIQRALISVSDKTKLSPLLKVLKKYKIELISSGGTYKTIKKMGYKSFEVSNYTGSPEILNGRVKTLHPKIHAGILSKRNNNLHKKALKKNNFNEIDLVIVNFYPFEEVISKTKNQNKIIENIDIGGPTLVRAAAKNFTYVTVIPSSNYYDDLIQELNAHKGSTSLKFREKMSREAFSQTGYYDSLISNFFNKISNNKFPNRKLVHAKLISKLRYGENPHQEGAIYSQLDDFNLKQLQGKTLSYNNFNDIFSAISVTKSFDKKNVTTIVKHANPCGVSMHKNKTESFKRALKSDPISAFGGVVSCNFKVDEKTAKEFNKIFLEVVVADGFEKKALKILKQKPKLRLIDASSINFNNIENIISNFENILLQTPDNKKFQSNNFKVVSKIKPSSKTLKDLIFAFNICRFAKSNAIILTKERSTVGIGSGQPSRLDSCKIAIDKMKKFNENNDHKLLAASDAFFPFVDGVECLIQAGVNAIIQPSGSIRDKEIIQFANKTKTILVFSKTRHFRH